MVTGKHSFEHVETAYALAAISVKGYKSLRDETTIKVRPLTILAGANSSGKSSFLQPLLLLKQTLLANYNPAGALLLDGTDVKLSEMRDCFSASPSGGLVESFTVGFSFKDGSSVKVRYGADKFGQPEILDSTHRYKRTTLILRAGMTTREIQKILPHITRGQLFLDPATGQTAKADGWRIVPRRGFLQLQRNSVHDSSMVNALAVAPAMLQVEEAIHIPSYRASAERSDPPASVNPPYVGAFRTYIASLIQNWQESRDRQHLLLDLAATLGELGLTKKVKTVPAADRRLEIRVGRTNNGLGDNDFVSLGDVGFGVAQVLPILVALLVAKRGQIVYIEDPEADLHPRAQVKLAKVLAKAANRGVLVIIETHSSLLLQGVQTLVAQGELLPGKVGLNWFQRRKSGFTKVHAADIDAQGRFGQWPSDFYDVILDSESAYLDAVSASRK